MKYRAEIDVMPQDALLDPQGKAVTQGLKNMGLSEVEDVRIGRHIRVFIEAGSKDEAIEKTKTACDKLLVNHVMEQYTFSVFEVEMA
ncbi:MAG: phosphoribosylformylglycinamidine synthase subunit PurS [Brumimicrobium sp.]|nr:phosphoribosylformylglycinamidine synthase subunit PurS [Brumimicrobium sp.]MCO5268766.1 phosphoribosylformylglycinamidine synthase subunit PurS [Brumimicrobium sp.]